MHSKLIWLALLLCGSVQAGTAVLSWTAPTLNTDGSALTDLTGYGIYRRCGTGALTQIATLPLSPRTHTDTVADGQTCWWSLTAIATSGTSVRTNEVSKAFVVGAPGSVAATFTWSTRPRSNVAAAFVQAAHATADAVGANSSITANFAANITAGNSVAIFCFLYSGGAPSGFSITSTGETVIAIDGSDLNDVGVSTWRTYYIKSAAGGHTDVTFAFTGQTGNYPRFFIVEVSGVDTTAPLDASFLSANDSAHFNNTGTTDACTAAITPVTDGSILVAALLQGFDTTVPTAGTGWTSRDTLSNAVGDATQVQTKVQTTAAAINATWTYSGSATAADFAVLAFKPAAAAAASSLAISSRAMQRPMIRGPM